MAQVKICGLKTPQDIAAAVGAGAQYTGFVFFPKSPRAVSVDQARDLAGHVPTGVMRVGLFVDPDDALLDQTLATVPLEIALEAAVPLEIALVAVVPLEIASGVAVLLEIALAVVVPLEIA